MENCTVCGGNHPCLDELSSRVERLEDSLGDIRYMHLRALIERERAARGEGRQFAEQIFLGNGRFSEERVAELKERLDHGLTLLSGMQQPPHPENKEQAEACNDAYKEDEAELETVVRDLVAALTGKEVEFISDDEEPERMV